MVEPPTKNWRVGLDGLAGPQPPEDLIDRMRAAAVLAQEHPALAETDPQVGHLRCRSGCSGKPAHTFISPNTSHDTWSASRVCRHHCSVSNGSSRA